MREIDELVALMARLRDPQAGCPWDHEQTYASIVPHTIEEAYEVAHAIERGDFAELESELGDLLFQVVFYAQIAAEEGRFDFARVAAGITRKMVSRHPHVFGDASVADAAAQTAAWERAKAAERTAAGAGLFDGVPRALPALTRAAKLQKRAAQAGRWQRSRAQAAGDIGAALAALDFGAPAEQAIGKLLFAAVALAREAGIDPEQALRGEAQRYQSAHEQPEPT